MNFTTLLTSRLHLEGMSAAELERRSSGLRLVLGL